jgi:hypothetical protein
MKHKFFSLIFILILFVSFAKAQQTEITIQLSEQFFDTLLDATFKNLKQPEFSLAEATTDCSQKLTLQREMNGVRTAVRFRDGKIYAPIAFTGNYNFPLVGCTEFSGYAETNLNLEFDKNSQTLQGRATVLNVQLNEVPKLGGSILAKLIQSSIDKKINPIQILKTDKLSFILPIQENGNLNMRATNVRHEIGNGFLNVIIGYEFLKA